MKIGGSEIDASAMLAFRLTGLASLLHPAWLLGAVLISLPFVGRTYLDRRRQTRELLKLARRHNLKFSPADLIGLYDRYWNLALIRRGHNRHAWNVLYGSTEAGLVAIFRFSYELGFGLNRSARSWWVAVLESPQPFKSWQAEPAVEGEKSAAPAEGGLPGLPIEPVLVRANAPVPEASIVPPAAVTENKRSMLAAAPVYCSVPLSSTRFVALLLEAPMSLAEPPLASVPTVTMPPLRVVTLV